MIDNPLKSLAGMPCTKLKGVGSRLSERLLKCGITTVQDLLFYLPFRYQDRTRIVPIGNLRIGDQAVLEGVIEYTEISKKRRPALLCHLHDGTGRITLRFFHFNTAQKAQLIPSLRLRCFGEVRGWGGQLEIIHPEYRHINSAYITPVDETLTPIYLTTEGLQQQSWQMLTRQALALLDDQASLPEYFPETLLKNFKLLPLVDALRCVHRPPPDVSLPLLEKGLHPAQQRLAFEELLAHHLSLRRLRTAVQQHRSPAFNHHNLLVERFLRNLPFTLTSAQQRVSQQIASDLCSTSPMMRLLQGDVGSGKTVVAALAILQAVEAGYQAALMAPTELLAEQHFKNFSQWLGQLGIQTVWLSGKLSGKARSTTLANIANAQAQVIVGTHALFQKDIEFARLGLMVVDEQHRFGVEQRLTLREKGNQEGCYPHQLIMTATPIPRTLTMIFYADLDHSVIDELPPGRTPITTAVISNQRRDDVVNHIQEACQQGRQAYWVCTLIEESDVLVCQAAEVVAAQLIKQLPELKIGLIHGRMKSQQKEQVMAAFKDKEIDLLVATTVIEVGVDVPNASLMIIENAERLGLAQLHQLRGRVGRGAVASHCVLMYQDPLSFLAKERLAILRKTMDGFELARKDLELRGPGEILGTRQAGALRLRIADIVRDQKLLPHIQEAAEFLLQHHPDLVELLIRRWLPAGEQYGVVG